MMKVVFPPCGGNTWDQRRKGVTAVSGAMPTARDWIP